MAVLSQCPNLVSIVSIVSMVNMGVCRQRQGRVQRVNGRKQDVNGAVGIQIIQVGHKRHILQVWLPILYSVEYIYICIPPPRYHRTEYMIKMPSRYNIPFSWYWQGLPLRNQLRPVYTGPEPCCHDQVQTQSQSQAQAPQNSTTRSRRKEPCRHDPYCPSSRADPTPGPDFSPGAEAEAEAEAEPEHSCSLCTGPSSIQYHTHAYFYPSVHYDYVFCPCPDCQEYISCCQCSDCHPERVERAERTDSPRHRRFDRSRRVGCDVPRYRSYSNGNTHSPGNGHGTGNGTGNGHSRVRVRTPTPPDTDSASVVTGWSECEEECCVTRYPVISRGRI